MFEHLKYSFHLIIIYPSIFDTFFKKTFRLKLIQIVLVYLLLLSNNKMIKSTAISLSATFIIHFNVNRNETDDSNNMYLYT